MRETEYIVTIGSANMDVAGYFACFFKLCGLQSGKN
ncbi:pyrimidine kinase [Citrobacter koseri]|uniref:Pyrimidine kinase n=1 Tax=Citrobacter koseri TaxID=545 RepID=A0A3S4J1X9_CITKO|nr:pyrimidine kinase [Citrobacter koseri]